jgi:hypothetical protein
MTELREIVALAIADAAPARLEAEMLPIDPPILADAAIAAMWPVMREMCAAWHDEQAKLNDHTAILYVEASKSDELVGKPVERAHMHRASAEAIRNLEPPK